MNPINPKVDVYLVAGCGRCPLGNTPDCKVNRWQEELHLLRSLVLDCGLTEELKWGVPCYTFQGNNVLIVSAFKDYCSVSFFKGALLQNAEGKLIKQGDNSQAARLLRFTSVQEIVAQESVIKNCIFEAIEIEKAGLKVDFKPIAAFERPEELEKKMAENPDLKKAFEALSHGRQRGYLLYFSQPKQAKTREARIEKYTPYILEGKGLND